MDLPNFIYKPGMGRPIQKLPEPGTMADRAAKIRIAAGFDEQKKFSRWLGLSDNRWGNYERGFPIPASVAKKVSRKVPVTVGYILDGETAGLSLEMARRLEILPAADAS